MPPILSLSKYSVLYNPSIIPFCSDPHPRPFSAQPLQPWCLFYFSISGEHVQSFFLDVFVLCVWVFRLHEGMWITCVPGAHWDQRKALDPPRTRITDGNKPPCGFWEPNPGSLEEHPLFILNLLSSLFSSEVEPGVNCHILGSLSEGHYSSRRYLV